MYEEKVLSIIEDIIKGNYGDRDILYDRDMYSKILKNIEKNEIITNEVDDIWKESKEQFIFYVNNNNQINSNIDEINIPIIKKIDKMNNEVSYTELNIYIIFHTIKEKLSFDTNYIKLFKKTILNKIKLKKLDINARKIDIRTIFIGNINEKDFSIRINDRVRSLETSRNVKINKEDNFGLNIKGFVFNANLRDLTKIYNDLGNELFDKNLRYSIKDQLNVDLQIKNTLEKNPEEFWYLNNGITMIIEDDDFKLRRSDSIAVKYGNQKTISIINGAQTITASSEYFYQNNNIESSAQVILRIIHISRFGCNNDNQEKLNKLASKEINKISIALNRQKPIKQEDIAYTTSFVYCINKLNEDYSEKKQYFKITKRSKISSKGYELSDIGRIVKSYLQQEPGIALNQTANQLFSLDSEGELANKEIFRDELREESKSIEIFNKFYSPVNLAVKLMSLYSTNAKKVVAEEVNDNVNIANAIASYGKYYFIAYIIYILNNNSNTDFSEFDIDESILKNDKDLKEIIKDFIELLSKSIVKNSDSSKNINISINNFKQNEIYTDFIDSLNKDPLDDDLSESIKLYNEKVYSYFKKNLVPA